MAYCPGCATLSCVQAFRSQQHLLDVDEKWLLAHGLLEPPCCKIHGRHDKFKRAGSSWQCMKGSKLSANRCRQAVAVMYPLVNEKAKLTGHQVLQMVGLVADHHSSSKISHVLAVNKKTTVERFLRRLEVAALRRVSAREGHPTVVAASGR
jgi:hypothetical protein